MPIKYKNKFAPKERSDSEVVDRLKAEFVSIISHQMRTPLSAVKWNLESLLENKRGNKLNAWQRDKLHEAYQGNERMINLVDDLLNLSQLDSGNIKLNLEKIDMCVLCREVVQQNNIFARANNVNIVLKQDASIPAVLGDRNKLIQVVDNLLNNAIKYSQGHDKIVLSASEDGQMVVFSIKDQGIGIAEENQEYIFDKFFRAKNAFHNQADGTGLGLFVVKRLVELQGGKVWFESEVNRGSTFFFSLPKYFDSSTSSL